MRLTVNTSRVCYWLPLSLCFYSDEKRWETATTVLLATGNPDKAIVERAIPNPGFATTSPTKGHKGHLANELEHYAFGPIIWPVGMRCVFTVLPSFGSIGIGKSATKHNKLSIP